MADFESLAKSAIMRPMNEVSKKTILRKIPYGLYVIGVKDKQGHHAFTGSWL